MKGAPLVAAALFAALLVFALRPPEGRHGLGGASADRDPGGTSLARAYLEAREDGPPVHTLARPIGRAHLPTTGVVFRIVSFPGGERRLHHDAGQPLDEDEEEDDDDALADEDEPRESPDGGRGISIRVLDGGALAVELPDGGSSSVPPRGDRFTVGPAETPDGGVRTRHLLGAADERWIASGGRLVLASAIGFPELTVQALEEAPPVEKRFPALPSVSVLQPTRAMGLLGSALDSAVDVFSRGTAPVLARRRIGQGELWLLANPEILDNSHLGVADHLALLVALAGADRPVYFDETVHGVEDDLGVAELLKRWGLGPAVALAALALGFAFWRARRPLGPPPLTQDTRSESVDLVESLAILYDRSLQPAQALDLHRQRLLRTLQLQEHLTPEAAEVRLQALVAKGPDASGPVKGRLDFQRRLTQLNLLFGRLRDRTHTR